MYVHIYTLNCHWNAIKPFITANVAFYIYRLCKTKHSTINLSDETAHGDECHHMLASWHTDII